MDVVMPQLGETVTEGTITRWFKQVGEAVEADEPLFEVSTDKVDSEVPAPAAGVLTEIRVPEGDTVDVGEVLAVLADSGDAVVVEAPPPAAEPEPAAAAPTEADTAPAVTAPPPRAEPASPPMPAPTPVAAVTAAASAPPAVPAGVVVSPIVRRLLTQHELDPATIAGTGDGGRITRNDVLEAARSRRGEPGPATAPGGPTAAPAPATRRPGADETVPFDNIRRLTAEHMLRSKATSAHVYTSVEVDFERIAQVRAAHKEEWKEREGFSLTYLPFIVRAIVDAIDSYPHVNSSVDGDALLVHHDVNLGIAVDLDFKGLVAPVVRAVQGKRLRLIATEIRDLAGRAHSKRLSPDEIVGGTFTITNMGPFGTHMTLPIINQPQVAILATDGIAKRPVAVEGPDGEDTIAIHHVGYLALAWDHRAFDGAYAASFLNEVREVIETRDWSAELA